MEQGLKSIQEDKYRDILCKRNKIKRLKLKLLGMSMRAHTLSSCTQAKACAHRHAQTLTQEQRNAENRIKLESNNLTCIKHKRNTKTN